jgi:GNAT superfamily N-acetyltransferase
MTPESAATVHVSTDKLLLDTRLIIDFLHGTHWAKDFSDKRILKSIEHSLCFGVYENKQQVGFARVVTDYTYSAWIADVFIVVEKQRQGYGHILMNAILTHDSLRDIIKWRLATVDKHAFYEGFGFRALEHPGRMMERIL